MKKPYEKNTQLMFVRRTLEHAMDQQEHALVERMSGLIDEMTIRRLQQDVPERRRAGL